MTESALRLLGILSGVIVFIAGIPYVIEIIKGRTKPQRMAWVIFFTLSGVSFFAQLQEGAIHSLWFPLVLLVNSAVVFALTLKFGMGGVGTFDVACLFAAIGIMLIWAMTKSPSIAIVSSVAVNTIGKVLVAKKVYHHPETEYLPTWIWSAIASVLAVLSVGKLAWILILTPLQNAITVGAIALLIIRRRGAQRNSNQSKLTLP
jgi:hypothetical protein